MKTVFCLIVAAGLVLASVPSLHAQAGAQANAPALMNSGAPSNGTSEIQTLTIGGTPTGGTFKLAFDGFQTAAITWSATNGTLVSNIQTALNNLDNLANGEVTAAVGTMTAGIGTITLTFSGDRAKLAVNLIAVASSLTGTSPTAAVTETTPGITATGRGAAKGRLLIDTDNGALYINGGTRLVPAWSLMDSVAVTVPADAVADLGAVTVGSAIAAFTDPPSAAEMALLRTFVNALKTDAAANRAKINAALAELRQAGVIAP